MFILFCDFVFVRCHGQRGKRWQKQGGKIQAVQGVFLGAMVMILQYNDIAHHCALKRRREGRKQGRQIESGQGYGQKLLFSSSIHSFVCFIFSSISQHLPGNTGVCIFLALLFLPARHRPSDNPCDDLHLLRMS